jgi:hypothetical protein
MFVLRPPHEGQAMSNWMCKKCGFVWEDSTGLPDAILKKLKKDPNSAFHNPFRKLCKRCFGREAVLVGGG